MADLDLDGNSEVVAGNSAYHADGSLYWNAAIPDGFPAVGNFDEDPYPEIVVTAQQVVYLLEHDGTVKWSSGRLTSGWTGGAPTVGDFDGDGEPEIGVATSFAYYVLETDGSVKWSTPVTDGSSGMTGSTLFDFDGDGNFEVVYGDENAVRIYDGRTGVVLFERSRAHGTALETPIVADVDADGNAEIIYGAMTHSGFPAAGLYVIGDKNDTWVSTRKIWNQHTYHITNVNEDGTIPQFEEDSWDVHNTYRANVQLDRSPFAAPDLTSSYVRVEKSGGDATVTARIGNGGEVLVAPGIPVSFYDAEPNAGGLLLGTVETTQLLHPGQFEDVTITLAVTLFAGLWVVADDDGTGRGQVSECSEVNNVYYLAGTAEIHGTKFHDENGDGIHQTDPPELVLNGSFEQGPTGADIIPLRIGSPEVSDWRVVSGQVDYLSDEGTGPPILANGSDGHRYFDLGSELFDNPSFEAPVGFSLGQQGNMPPNWSRTIPSPDLWSSDGSFGLGSGSYDNFAGVTAYDKLGWVAGWSLVPEVFSQQLSAPLTPGEDYTLSAYMIQAKRSDLDNPGGYTILLNSVNSLMGAAEVATLAPTTDSDQWEFRSTTLTLPDNAEDDLSWIIFLPYATEGTSYPGLDAVSLTSPGAIAQSVDTIPGESYRVTFEMAGNVDRGPATRELLLSAAGSSQLFQFDTTGHTAENPGWETMTWDFLATDESTTIEFVSQTVGAFGPLIDNVSVRAVLSSIEPGLPDWTIYIDGNNNSQRNFGEHFATTDENGDYAFTGLAAGTYIVREEQQPGWVQTTSGGVTTHALYAAGIATYGPKDLYRIEDYGSAPKAVKIGLTNVALGDIAIDPMTGAAFGVSVSGLYSIDLATGNTELTGIHGASGLNSLEFAPDGRLFAMSWLDTHLYRLDMTTGAASAVFDTGFTSRGDLAFDDNNTAFLADSDKLVKLDLATQTATVVGLLSPPSMAGLDFDASGQLFGGYGADGYGVAQIYSIDKLTGQSTLVGSVAGADDTGLVGMSFDRPRLQQLTGTTTYEITIFDSEVIADVDFGNQFVGAVGPNEPPEFRGTPLTAAVTGGLYRYDSVAADPNLDPLGFDLVVRPAGMAVDGSSGIVVWRPRAEDIGTHDVILRVRDGRGGIDLQSFQVTVTTNHAPVITSSPALQATAGFAYAYQVRAQDADGDTLEFLLDQSPAGATIDAATGLLRWNATTLGTHPIVVTARDNQGGETSQSFDLTVLDNLPNDPPEITSLPRTQLQLSQRYLYNVRVVDPNGDPIEYFLDQAPTGMTLDGAGFLEWTPTSGHVGSNNSVRLRVEDGRGGIDTQDFSIDVVTFRVNSAPTITSDPMGSVVVGATYAYEAVASDPDNDIVVWSLGSRPNGMSVDPLSGAVRWDPSSDQIGEHVVELVALDGQGGSDSQSFAILVRGVNTPPTITSTAITQAYVDNRYVYSVAATDVDADVLQYIVAGPPDMTIDSATGLMEWTPTSGDVGTHTITVAVSDGQVSSTQVFDVVVSADAPNNLPVIVSNPDQVASAGIVYHYDVEAIDADSHAITYLLVESPGGMTIDAITGLVQWTPSLIQAGTHTITVAAIDFSGMGSSQRFDVHVFASNEPPEITSPPVTTVAAGATYRYDVRASDPDGDLMQIRLTDGPVGMQIDTRLGRIEWTTTAADVGSHRVEVTVTDGKGGVAVQAFAVEVGADIDAPLVNISFAPNPANLGDTIAITVNATDDVGVTLMSLLVGGTPIALDSSGRGTIVAGSVGLLNIIATATDAAGNVGETTTTLNVGDPSDIDAPVVAINSPAFGDQVTSVVDVIGTVTDDTLVSYTLSYAALGGGEFIEIASGTDPVTDGVLGRFDSTLLGNDTYILQLFAQDASGKTAIEQVLVDVTGELKIGNFVLSFTDLSIPVAGIPITVARTYDSLNASSASDFGFGWRLEFADADIRTSVAKTQAEEDLIYNPFYDGARVYVTLPGGKREGFTFRLNLAPGVAGTYLGIYEGKFVADSGVTSTLTAETYQLRSNEYGEALEYLSAFPWNPLSPTFGGGLTLTTVDGTRFSLDGTTGDVREIADRNDNTLTFREDGIVSSDGQEVRFERDPQGRIVAVIDPLGNRIGYSYDGNGNLAAVTDREGNTTRYLYDEPTRPHYLTEVVDPLGRTGIRSEYDTDGRLIKMIDADGKEISLTHDPASQLETVTNQLGFPTVFEYDDLGNVIREVDAEGGVTLSQYADSRNPTLETAITRVLPDGTELTTTYAYDARGNVTVETDPAGNVTWTTYDTFGNVLTSTDPLGNTSTNRYDTRGNLLSIVDADGSATTFSYDSSGNPLTIAIGTNVTTFQYDGQGRVTRQTDAVGTVKAYTYDAIGNQLTETVSYSTPQGPSTVVTESTYDADGRVVARVTRQDGVTLATSETEYDAAGNRVEEIDALGRRTKFVYDDRGLMTKTLYPDDTPADDTDNPRTRTEYDAAGQVIAEIDELGRATRFVYDRVGRRSATIHPDDTPADDSDNPRTETQYDAIGRVLAEIDERGNRVEFRYDVVGNRTETILPDATPGDLSDNPRLQDQYDASGRRTSSIDPLGNTTRFVYTDGGLPLETILPDATPGDLSDNPRLRSEFDNQRRLVARIDAAGRSTGYEYDDLGRLAAVLQTVDSQVLRTEYEYNELGGLVVQRDAEGRETHFEYDGLGRRTATVLPLGQRNSTQYDAVGRAESTTDFNGDTIAYQYDTRDRLTSKQFPDSTTVEFGYTTNGLRESVVDARGTTTFQYDARDRLLSRTDPDGRTISYTYDVAGNRTSVTIPSGITTYTFDELNRQSTVTDPESGLTSYAYDASGRLVLTTLPNGTSEVREYDAQNRLLFLENRSASDVISSYRYTLDPAGNRTAVDEHDGRRVEYDYDEIYRLVEERIFDPGDNVVDRTISYLYDDVGNRQSRADSSEGTTTYNYDDNDRLLDETLDSIVTAYTYDDNGNTLSKQSPADTVFYHWDFENRLVGVDTDGDGSIDVTNEYDADGIRVSQTVSGDETRFLIDANRPFQQVLEEYTPGGIIKVTYLHGLDLISQNRHGESGKSFYHVDGLGSTRALSDALGIVTDRYIYDAYGRTISPTVAAGNDYYFTGEQRDTGTNLDYLRARFFDASTGRFMSRDPLQLFLALPDSMQPYGYVSSNPVNNVDPAGLMALGQQIAAVSVHQVIALAAFASVNLVQVVSRQSSNPAKRVKWTGELSTGSITVAGGATLRATSDPVLINFRPTVFEGEWIIAFVGLEFSPLNFSATGSAGVLWTPGWALGSVLGSEFASRAFSGTAFLAGYAWTNGAQSSSFLRGSIGFGFADFSGSFDGIDISAGVTLGVSVNRSIRSYPIPTLD